MATATGPGHRLWEVKFGTHRIRGTKGGKAIELRAQHCLVVVAERALARQRQVEGVEDPGRLAALRQTLVDLLQHLKLGVQQDGMRIELEGDPILDRGGVAERADDDVGELVAVDVAR